MTGGQTPMTPLPVSLYFMPEWWDRHYHAGIPRPSEPSQDALESLYLGRLRAVLDIIGAAGRRHGRKPNYETMPLCWEEMQWAHSQYKGN